MEVIETQKFLEWESPVKYTDEKLKQKIEKVLKGINICDIVKLEKAKRDKVLQKIMQIDGANK